MTSDQPGQPPVKPNKPDNDAVMERFFTKWLRYRDREMVGWGELYDLLDETDLALNGIKDDPELYRQLNDIRNTVLERLENRAKELGKTSEWEELKKARGLQQVLGKLGGMKGGVEFFDAVRDLSPEQRNTLAEAVPDVRVKKYEPLADALRRDSAPGMLLGLLRTNPLYATKLLVRYFWLPVAIVFYGGVLLWHGYPTLAALVIILGVVLAVRVASR